MQDESARKLALLQSDYQRQIEETREQADEALEMSEKERERIRVCQSCLSVKILLYDLDLISWRMRKECTKLKLRRRICLSKRKENWNLKL